jgi:hypothetical protein
MPGMLAYDRSQCNLASLYQAPMPVAVDLTSNTTFPVLEQGSGY